MTPTSAGSVVTYGAGCIRRDIMKPNSYAIKAGIPAVIQNEMNSDILNKKHM